MTRQTTNIIASVALLAIISGVAYYNIRSQNKTGIIVSPTVIPLDKRSPPEQLRVLSMNPQLMKIPEILQETSVSISSFPQHYLNLFDSNMENLSIKSVVYKTGKGFVANFTETQKTYKDLNSMVTNILSKLPPSANKNYTRSDNAAILNFDSNNYHSIVTILFNSDSTFYEVRVYLVDK